MVHPMTSGPAASRLSELEHQLQCQSRTLEQSSVAGPDRMDAVRRLRILTNAMELIRPQVG